MTLPDSRSLSSRSGVSRKTIGRSSSAYSLDTEEASLMSRSVIYSRGITSSSRTTRQCASSHCPRRANQSISLFLGWSCNLMRISYFPVEANRRMTSSPIISSELCLAPVGAYSRMGRSPLRPNRSRSPRRSSRPLRRRSVFIKPMGTARLSSSLKKPSSLNRRCMYGPITK